MPNPAMTRFKKQHWRKQSTSKRGVYENGVVIPLSHSRIAVPSKRQQN